MAAQQVTCPNSACRRVISGAGLAAGTSLRCPYCATTFTLPESATVETAPGKVPPAAGDSAAAITNAASLTTIGRYQIKQSLGEGQFGAVYLAFDPELHRDVAIKVLKSEALSNPNHVDRFLREGRVVAGFVHSNIVPVYDQGRADGRCFVVSAYIKGGTLGGAIRDKTPEPRQAVRWTMQLLRALADAYAREIVHRDVKPQNVVLDEEGNAFLMDFGLAGLHSQQGPRLTRIGTLMGTPAYMAPEQAKGDTHLVGPAADQYSVGVILYEMLSGTLPFEGNNLAGLIYHVVNTPPPRPSEHCAGLDPALEALCLKVLAKLPEERFASCKAFADELESWLAGRSQQPVPSNGKAPPPPIVPAPQPSNKSSGIRPRTAPAQKGPPPLKRSAVRAPSLTEARPRRKLRLLIVVLAIAAILLPVALALCYLLFVVPRSDGKKPPYPIEGIKRKINQVE